MQIFWTKNVLPVFLAPFLMTGLLLGQGQNLADSYYHFSLARLLSANEDYTEAVEHLEKALAIDPDSASLHLEFARVLLQMQKVEEAILEGEKAAGLSPGDLEPHLFLGTVYFASRGEPERLLKAEEEFKKVLEIDPEHAPALSRLGELYFSRQNYDEAARVFGQLVDLDPDEIRGYYFQAQALQQMGELDKALDVMERGLEIRDDIPEYLEIMGGLYDQTGRTERAIETLSRSHVLSPDPKILQRLTQLLLQAGRSEEAVPLLQEAVATHPQEIQLRIDLGRALREEWRIEESMEVFEQILVDSPHNLEANYEMARLLTAIGERNRAIEKFEELIGKTQSGGVQWVFQINLALLYQDAGRYDDAISLYQQVLALNPDDLDTQLRLFYALRGASRTSEALSLSFTLLSKNADNVEVVTARAQALADADRFPEALALLDQRLHETSEPELLYLAKSQLFVDAEKLTDAQETVKTALTLYPESEQLKFQSGAIYERLKDYDSAERIFQALLQGDPDDANVLNYLGYMLADRGVRLEEAVGYIQKAVTVNPYNGAYLDSLGWAYFKLNRLEQAEIHLRKAAQLSGDDPVILEHLGDLYLKLGEIEKARQYYLESMSLTEQEQGTQRIEKKLAEMEKNH